MGARLKQLAGQSFVYGLGGIVSKLVGIFLLPIYTKPEYVSQAGFGQVETVMAASSLAAIVFQFGLPTAMFRFSWDNREPDARRRTIRTVFTGVLALSTVLVVVGVILIQPIASGLQVTHELALIGVGGLWVSVNYSIITGIYRIEQRADGVRRLLADQHRHHGRALDRSRDPGAHGRRRHHARELLRHVTSPTSCSCTPAGT